MSVRFIFVSIVLVLLFVSEGINAQTVGVSSNSSYTVNTNAILDLDASSGTKGLLIPRMSLSQRGIVGPPSTGFTVSLGFSDKGMTIFNVTSNRYEYWDGSDWVAIGTGVGNANTLDEAYDGGGSGLGRVILSDAGAVDIQGPGGFIVNGNVGVGTVSQAQKLTVSSGNSGDANILIQADADNNNEDDHPQLRFSQDGGAVNGFLGFETDGSDNNVLYLSNQWADAAADVRVRTQDVDRLTVDGSGNVGIGVSSPLNLLHIQNTGANTSARIGYSPSYTDNLLYFGEGSDVYVGEKNFDDRLYIHGRSFVIDINGNVGSFGEVLKSDGISTYWGVDEGVTGSGTLNYLARWTPDGSTLGVGTTYDDGNNVGIGTTLPTQKLQVEVDNNGLNVPIFIRNKNNTSGNNGVGIGFISEVNNTNAVAKSIFFNERIGNYGVGKFHFLLNSNNSSNTSATLADSKMTITNQGNVGIGEVSPSQKLHISHGLSGDGGWDDGGILVQNTGTAGEAALSFNNSETAANYWITGLNQSAHLDFAYGNAFTNGNTLIRLQNNGFLGLGTVSPSTQLHTTGGVRFQTLSGTGSRFVVADANGNLSASSSTGLGIVTGSGTADYLVRWTPDGATLGIGVVRDNGSTVGVGMAPVASRQLSIAGDVFANSGSFITSDLTGNVDHIWNDDGNSSGTGNGLGTWNFVNDDAQGSPGNAGIRAGNLYMANAGNVNQFAGNVGIGTSPAINLHVSSTGDAGIWIEGDSDNATETDNAFLKITQDGQLVNSIIGFTGATNVDPEGNAYTGTLNNALLVGVTTAHDLQFGTSATARMTIESGGDVGIGTTNPDDELDVVGNAQVSGYLKVGNPTSGTTTRYASETFFMTSNMNLSSGYLNSASLGTLTVPSGASSFTVTKVIYSFTGYHDDGDEQHGAMVRIGSTDFGAVYENGSDGYTDVTWNNTSSHSTSFTSTQNVYFRLYDENDNCLFCSNNTFHVLNANITIYYSYSVGAQTGDVLAQGAVYTRSIHSMNTIGDVAEYFDVKTETGIMPQVGQLVSFLPGSETEFQLSKEPYDSHIAGVISENPSVVLNSPTDGAPIALTGRVKVQLKDDEKLIKSGEFITSSDIPGLGMRAISAGPVIGYAISNQKPGEQTVEVLLQPGRFYFPKEKIESMGSPKPDRTPGMSSSPR